MSWFTPYAALSQAARTALEELVNSSQSESAAVADCLNTIASNGDESATDEFLISCAQEIIDAARAFIKGVTPKPEPADADQAVQEEEYYRRKARQEFQARHDDGDVEINDAALVSYSPDGCFVEAFVWIRHPDKDEIESEPGPGTPSADAA